MLSRLGHETSEPSEQWRSDGGRPARETRKNMIRVGFFLGTFEDWGGASRALLNFIRSIDRQRFEPVVVVTKEGNLSAELRASGLECVCWPKHELSRNPLSNAYHIMRSARFLKDTGVNIVHLNYGATEWKSPIVTAARWMNVPIVYHYHSEIKAPSRYVSRAAAVIVVSDYIKQHANTLGRPAHTIHNIVDIRRFASGTDIRGELGIPEDSVVVAFVGQIKVIKGVKTLLRAIKRIDNANIRFVMAGEFREKGQELTKKTFEDAVAADDRILYLGYRTDAPNLYQTADIVVMPSLYDEPCAMVLFEAAAARKPVVASATGGTPEVIQDNVNGILFDRDDESGLANAIQRLAEDAALRGQMGNRAYGMALEQFAALPVKKLENLYEDTLK